MRWLTLILASLTMALVLSTPAFAQGNGTETPAGAQYDSEALSVGDIPRALTDPAARGTGSLNETLKDPASPEGEAAASETDSVAGITVLPETGGGLPETGGGLPVAPCAGVLLVAGGLLVGRSVRR